MKETEFYKMRSIFDIDNMRAVEEFNSVGDSKFLWLTN